MNFRAIRFPTDDRHRQSAEERNHPRRTRGLRTQAGSNQSDPDVTGRRRGQLARVPPSPAACRRASYTGRMDEMDIYGKIEKYSDLTFGIDVINQEKQALIDQVLTPEIKENWLKSTRNLTRKLKTFHSRNQCWKLRSSRKFWKQGGLSKALITASYGQLRVSWDTKALDGYAAAHPEIQQFRIEGLPSVSVRKA